MPTGGLLRERPRLTSLGLMKLPEASLSRTTPARTIHLIQFFKTQKKSKKRKGEKRRVAMGVWRRAEEWGAILDSGVVKNQSGLARHLGVSRARVSEVLAVRSVHGPLRELLLRAENSDQPVTDRAWRKVRRLPPQQAVALLRERGFGQTTANSANNVNGPGLEASIKHE